MTNNNGIVSTYKTVKFKIHNPSQHKRAMLMDSMKRAHLGYSKIIAAIESDVRALIGLSKKERKPRLSEITRKCAEIARPLPIPISAKNALQIESMAQVDSFLELITSDENTAYPTCGRLNANFDIYARTLNAISIATEEGSERELAGLLNKSVRLPNVRPFGIYNNRATDGFLLLMDGKGRLFAWINLHSKNSRFAQPVNVQDMVNTRTGEIMSFRSSTGVLFPLEMSHDYHVTRFLKKGRAQSARLIHCDGEFFLAVTFLYQAAASQPTAYIGIDRGIENLAAWGIVDVDGKPISKGRIDGTELRAKQKAAEQKKADEQKRGIISTGGWRSINDIAVHTAANEIVKLAIQHNAQVVMEDLSAISNGHHHRRPKGQRRVGFSKLLSRAMYQKLEKVLTYKLALEGFPPPVDRHAAGTSTTCPVCGHRCKENRASQAEFRCVKCGHTDHADENAGVVIALKGKWLDDIKPTLKKGVKMVDEQKFEGWLRARQAA